LISKKELRKIKPDLAIGSSTNQEH